jgi:hypothetical protein
MRNLRQIAFGCVALASIPAVAWLSFSYHVAVGVVVTMIYGSAAALAGTISIGRAALSLASQAHERAAAKRLSTLPEARLLGDGSKR